ncbi:hypothetical protein GIX45_19400 [Erwinia sp. CPCC 100877]|nr:hypothetical protein [Erwinia sp. CPCC 100877]
MMRNSSDSQSHVKRNDRDSHYKLLIMEKTGHKSGVHHLRLFDGQMGG